jgi:hypothetical protein
MQTVYMHSPYVQATMSWSSQIEKGTRTHLGCQSLKYPNQFTLPGIRSYAGIELSKDMGFKQLTAEVITISKTSSRRDKVRENIVVSVPASSALCSEY